MSTLNVGTLRNLSGTEVFTCKAWVNFNGTGTNSTNQTVRGQGNVSSVFKNGTADYTINFTTSMSDSNYAICGSATVATTGALPRTLAARSSSDVLTSSVRVHTSNDAGQYENCVLCSVAIFR
jgi:hypothetical protein